MSERPISTRPLHSRRKSEIGSAEPIQWPLNGSYDGSIVTSGKTSRNATANRSTTANRVGTATVRFSSQESRAVTAGQPDIKPRDNNRAVSSSQVNRSFAARKTSISFKDENVDAMNDLKKMRERLYEHGSERSDDRSNSRRIVRQCSYCQILYSSFHLCQSTNSINDHK